MKKILRNTSFFKKSKLTKSFLPSLLGIILATNIAQSSDITSGGASKASFNTLDLINNTGEGLLDCSHYCIVGIQIRFIYIPPPINYFKIFYTPIVRHNTPDLLVMSAPSTDMQAWDDYRRIFSKFAKKIGDKLILAYWQVPATVGGGQSQYANFGQHQALTFKDSDVLGNVMAYLIENLDAETGNDQHYQGNKDDSTDADASAMLNQMSNNQSTQMSDSLGGDSGFGADFYKEVVKNHPSVFVYTEMVKQLVDAFKDSMSDMVVDYYGCDSAITPFKPYYISNIDGIFWRSGYPLSDPHKSVQILNPLSTDSIKPTKTEASSDSIIAMLPGGGAWGHMYPRVGFVDIADDFKVGAVAAARAVDIVLEEGTYRIRQYAGGNANDVIFQKIHPNKSSQCYYNIANSVSHEDNNTAQNYAWSGYRRYQCGLSQKGFHLADVIFGDDTLCLGQGPSDKGSRSSSPSGSAPSTP